MMQHIADHIGSMPTLDDRPPATDGRGAEEKRPGGSGLKAGHWRIWGVLAPGAPLICEKMGVLFLINLSNLLVNFREYI